MIREPFPPGDDVARGLDHAAMSRPIDELAETDVAKTAVVATSSQ